MNQFEAGTWVMVGRDLEGRLLYAMENGDPRVIGSEPEDELSFLVQMVIWAKRSPILANKWDATALSPDEV